MSRRRKRPPREPVTAIIESLSHEGRGIARVNGKTVFVNETLPGERVVFQYTRRHSRYGEAMPLEILDPSPERIDACCVHYKICGGCSFQHASPAFQLKHKQEALREQFEHISGLQPMEWLPPLTGPVWGYRRRARLAVKYVEKKGRLLIGFREKYSPFVADISRCEVLHPKVGKLLGDLQALISSLSIVRHLPQIEVAVADNATALVLRHLQPLTEEDKQILDQFETAQEVQFYLQPGGLDTVVPLCADRAVPLVYRMEEQSLEYYFQPTDFIQVNAAINQAMVSLAVNLLGIGKAHAILDLFCGLGNFSLPLAKYGGRVTAVEGDALLVERARFNAEHNRVKNVEFHVANLSSEDLSSPFLTQTYDRVLLDPPRTGALDIIRQLDLRHTERLVYVSCNPATLARDAAILVNEKGFCLQQAGVMDMFPHTAHIESITLFTRE